MKIILTPKEFTELLRNQGLIDNKKEVKSFSRTATGTLHININYVLKVEE